MFDERIPHKFWVQPQNQKKYFDWLMVQLGYKHMEDWYHLTTDDIHKHGGGGLPRGYFNSSLSLALETVYPQHKWELNQFVNQPHGHKQSLPNQRIQEPR